MPQGENWLKVTGSDPVGHQSSPEEFRVKVDHTAPALALSGNLTEQAKVGTKLPSYTLNYATADGEDATAAALTPYGTTGTAEGQLERPQGLAIDANGNIWVSDRVNNRITEYGPSGSFIRQINAHASTDGAISEPRGLAISPAGNVWVAENGNKRLQEFSPTGAFITKITNAAFVEPWGVATGSGGTLWVSDPGAHKIFELSESGTLLKTVTGGLLNPLTSPYGIAVDSSGDIWTADTGANKIVEFDSFGSRLFSFGAEGTGNGQLKAPTGLAITPSGHLFVSEDQNSRVQEFQPDGSYLRQFGSLGTASNQLTEPRQVAVGPENSLLIADAANHRIARWSHADQDPQSGVARIEVKVDGAVAKNEAPGCSTKDCQINSSWTLNADNYSVGSHKVEVIATDAVGLPTTKTLTVETHGDLTPPSVALSGSMTEQASLGTTRPSYKLNLSATDPGATEERKSGVASTTIKVDGKVVDSTSPGCPAEGCSITREWTLESSAYAAGAHTIEAIATDGAGHTTTKTLLINIERDTTAPQLNAGEFFYTAPKGWLEQKKYSYVATATDEAGYGVTSIELKIDGAVVKTSSGTCNAGGCMRFMLGSVDMSQYGGGAHPAELIATDGAGNRRKKAWTINVDPEGHISTSEAASTLEAADETSTANVLGESEEEPEVEGTDTGLSLEATEAGLVAAGSAAPTTVEPSSGGSITVEIPQPESIYGCGIEGSGTKESEPEEPAPTEPEEPATCAPGAQPEEEMMSVTVTPLGTSESAGSTNLVEENAAVTPNTSPEVDTAVRPLNEGGMIFTAIRGGSAPEAYSYRVELFEEQELRLIDDQHAEVFYEEGHPAFTITAEPAHDAIGTTVPTSLTVDGKDIVTLHVHYKPPAEGAPFVYPIVAGTGWQGGFETTQIEMPEPPAELEEAGEELWELEQLEEGNVVLGLTAVGPPEEVTPMTEAEKLVAELSPYEPWRKARKKFRFDVCHPHIVAGDPIVGGGEEGGRREQLMKVLHFHCRDPEYEGNYWWVTVSGRFHYVYHHKVWLNWKEWECEESGGSEIQYVEKAHCDPFYPHNHVHYPSGTRVAGPIGPMAEWRFPAGKGQFAAEGVPNCLTMGGWIFPNPRKGPGGYYEEPMEYQRPKGILLGEPCPAIEVEEEN
jgi:streptogramin lyase